MAGRLYSFPNRSEQDKEERLIGFVIAAEPSQKNVATAAIKCICFELQIL